MKSGPNELGPSNWDLVNSKTATGLNNPLDGWKNIKLDTIVEGFKIKYIRI